MRTYQKSFTVQPGLQTIVLNQIKENLQKAPLRDRVVNVLFDEISLQPEIHFDPHKDMFVGIADEGKERTFQIAKTVLVAVMT